MARHNWTWLVVLGLGGLTAVPIMADPLGPDVAKLDNERLEPGLYPAAPGSADYAAPAEPAHNPFNIDWSLGLKGTYTSSSRDGGNFLTALKPRFTATHEGVRTDIAIDGSAEIARSWDDGTIEVPSLRLGLTGTTMLGGDTTLSGNAAIALSRQLASAPGLDPLIVVPPEVVSGTAGLALERSFGRFNVRLGSDVARTLYGTTTRTDTGITDNSHQNLWEADSRLRLGFQATPIFEVFGEAGVGRDMFDVASPGLGVRTDATATTLRGGLTGSWNGILTASASIGVGRHDFDEAALGDITTQLYDASLSYRPTSTLELAANLSTNIEPTGADATGTAKVEHVATASVAYTVNSWLRLRASAEWARSETSGSGEIETRQGVGTGADYALGAHTAITADYGFSHRDNSVSGALDTHTVSLGITLKR